MSDVDEVADGVLAGDRTAIGRAITLVESTRADHRRDAATLLDVLMPHAGGAIRVGITGVPGVGKSTFIGAPVDKHRSPGCRACRGSIQYSNRRINPWRQDPDGEPVG